MYPEIFQEITEILENGHNHEENRVLVVVLTDFAVIIIGSAANPKSASNLAPSSRITQQQKN